MKKSLIVGLLTSVMFLSFASVVFADLPTSIQTLPEVSTFGQLIGALNRAMNIVFTVLIIGAVIITLFAAFEFLTGGGNPETLEKARGKIIWAVVAVVIALLAKGVPILLTNVSGGGTSLPI